MQISRRDALRGAAAVVATGAVPIAALANANNMNGDSALQARVSQWHEAYERVLEVSLFEEAHPEAEEEFYARGYGDAWGNLCEVQRELVEARPDTLVGAVALLGCAERNAADRGRRRAGEQVPEAVFFVHTNVLSKNAYAALRRLAGEARS